MRLQTFLARSGIASRRRCATLVKAGHAAVNGITTLEPGLTVDPVTDRVTFDGSPVSLPTTSTTIALNKPRGFVCSHRGQSSPTVFDLLGKQAHRLVCAGRLDKDSEGLVILSSDGDLVQQLTHPRYGHAKHYRVTVEGRIGEAALHVLRSPLVLDGYPLRPVEVAVQHRDQGSSTLDFLLMEGRNQQIRRMCRQAGLGVTRLVRVSVGPITIASLPQGQSRQLSAEECRNLREPPRPEQASSSRA